MGTGVRRPRPKSAEANLTTAERFDRRSSSPTAFSGDESASVTMRPDETREDGANDDAACRPSRRRRPVDGTTSAGGRAAAGPISAGSTAARRGAP